MLAGRDIGAKKFRTVTRKINSAVPLKEMDSTPHTCSLLFPAVPSIL